jgi:MerR family redox-sensitive transcriptional activator SoxR
MPTFPVPGGSPAQPPMFTIGELAARTGVATSALRFYEERGLIGSVRTHAGHRRYWRATTRRVAFIVFAQRVGLSLEEIGVELATLPTNRAPHGKEWARLSANWTTRIAERIEELRRLERGLTDCIGCGCLSLERCHVLNPGDRIAEMGSGPRFWLGDEPEEA